MNRELEAVAFLAVSLVAVVGWIVAEKRRRDLVEMSEAVSRQVNFSGNSEGRRAAVEMVKAAKEACRLRDAEKAKPRRNEAIRTMFDDEAPDQYCFRNNADLKPEIAQLVRDIELPTTEKWSAVRDISPEGQIEVNGEWRWPCDFDVFDLAMPEAIPAFKAQPGPLEAAAEALATGKLAAATDAALKDVLAVVASPAVPEQAPLRKGWGILQMNGNIYQNLMMEAERDCDPLFMDAQTKGLANGVVEVVMMPDGRVVRA
jgi:hypothetical protein